MFKKVINKQQRTVHPNKYLVCPYGSQSSTSGTNVQPQCRDKDWRLPNKQISCMSAPNHYWTLVLLSGYIVFYLLKNRLFNEVYLLVKWITFERRIVVCNLFTMRRSFVWWPLRTFTVRDILLVFSNLASNLIRISFFQPSNLHYT
jgi:hypothetical protein